MKKRGKRKVFTPAKWGKKRGKIILNSLLRWSIEHSSKSGVSYKVWLEGLEKYPLGGIHKNAGEKYFFLETLDYNCLTVGVPTLKAALYLLQVIHELKIR